MVSSMSHVHHKWDPRWWVHLYIYFYHKLQNTVELSFNDLFLFDLIFEIYFHWFFNSIRCYLLSCCKKRGEISCDKMLEFTMWAIIFDQHSHIMLLIPIHLYNSVKLLVVITISKIQMTVMTVLAAFSSLWIDLW